MKDRKIYITEDQLETIAHYKRMFNLTAETIYGLCSENQDDIIHGFELGKMHSHLRECFTKMGNLEDDIIKQNT